MKLLLDTHSFIFYVDRPDALPSAARAALEDSSNDLFPSPCLAVGNADQVNAREAAAR